MVAWGSPYNGIQVVAIRDTSRLDTATDISTPATAVAGTVVREYAPGETPVNDHTVDTTAVFPTLAYVHYDTTMSDKKTYHVAHLAWQQGNTGGTFIFYKPVGARISGPSARPTLLTSLPIEHTSQQVGSCWNMHPSIAVDSLRIAVAFETQFPEFTLDHTKFVVLRFRDSTTHGGTVYNRAWNTPAYFYGVTGYDSKWPSVTEFPGMYKSHLRDTLGGHAEGGLAWQRDSSSALHAREMLYRYETVAPNELPTGNFPTMTLAPYLQQSSRPFSKTSVFHRGDSSTKSGGSSPYYPAFMENTPSVPNTSFSGSISPRGTVSSYVRIIYSGNTYYFDFCDIPGVIAGLKYQKLKYDGDGYPSDEIDKPGLPGTFFAEPTGGATEVRNLDDATKVSRTSTFLAGASPVTIDRYVAGSNPLQTWLAAQPYDSTMHSAADIKVLTELVRASDGVVLWHGDTVSAFAVGYNEQLDEVEVPVDTATTPGTSVFIQLRAVPTAGLEYAVGAGFGFMEDTTSSFAKLIRSKSDMKVTGSTAKLSASVIPNPVRGSGELRIRLLEPGLTHIAIYDMLGNLMRELPSFEAMQPGEYSTQLDLSPLRNGMYTVRIEQRGTTASTTFTVVR